MKKVAKVSVVVTWAGLVGKVRWICFFTRFGASAPSASCGLLSSGLSSEEYSSTTFLSAVPPGLGSFFGFPFLFLFPLLTACLLCLSVQFAWFSPCNKETSTSRLYGKRSMLGQGALQFYIEHWVT